MVKRWNYPGGEVGIRLEEEVPHLFRIENSDDLVACLMTLDAARRAGKPRNNITIPYLPYARQDRVAVDGDPLAINVLAKLLSSLGVKHVNSYDVHSDKCIKEFEKEGIMLTDFIWEPIRCAERWLSDLKIDPRDVWLVSPDKGASGRSRIMCLDLGFKGIISCDKVRDAVSGKLEGMTVLDTGVVPEPNSILLIADDICDGGGTFKMLAKALKEKFAPDKILLFTTHGIYSNGTKELTDLFFRVGCTDSFVGKYSKENIDVMSVV